MVQHRTVEECMARDVAGDFLDSLPPGERKPRFKATKLGSGIENPTEEERDIVRKIGL